MSTLSAWFGPLYDAIFCPSLPFTLRWRLLGLQPIVFLTNTIQYLSTLFYQGHRTAISIPLKRAPGHSLRAIVYHPGKPSPTRLRPLHLNIHGGGFLGGLPEGQTSFCQRVADDTGAVVVSTSYRYAPRYTFPTAHEDVQDVAEWLVENAERLWNANPRTLSVSGFSAGGNLALGVAQWLAQTEFCVKASVTFYAPVDLRLPPWEKPKPAGIPEKDPLAWLLPLMDAYAGPERLENMGNPLLNPILADIESLPRHMMFVVPKVDILLQEQSVFIERLKEEAAAVNRGMSEQNSKMQSRVYRIESRFDEGQIHGWLEIPSIFIDAKLRDAIFDSAVQFLENAYASHE
ncbi:putative lipase/esterase family protein [Aspergillus clavatus NRRL 1]|uniref:Lipase/esterase family protein, putative n=1 Tax=Aspergillus clavatus (strain ATCC 1007 / CBS 513.65 / DSM 816 / NCTC 3887 / NRRL 1 / QM 1276 / 107) TaxID=344612 RepID=A1CLF3_ASPCL|nr:lipase/esterase family protein, putative [Aspergillus clavatus NRRL 1]EAW09977.1 lipase/esterase family protein, putative [Aspergillus clavatus NRRL 1]